MSKWEIKLFSEKKKKKERERGRRRKRIKKKKRGGGNKVQAVQNGSPTGPALCRVLWVEAGAPRASAMRH